MLRVLPIFPMFGRGQTRLQPAYVEDVAEAIARALRSPNAALAYELAGPRIYPYEDLLRTIAAGAGKTPLFLPLPSASFRFLPLPSASFRFLPLPFALWRTVGCAGKVLPNPPITTSQIELMEIDNIASPATPGFDALGIAPQAIEGILPQILKEAIGDSSSPDRRR